MGKTMKQGDMKIGKVDGAGSAHVLVVNDDGIWWTLCAAVTTKVVDYGNDDITPADRVTCAACKKVATKLQKIMG